MRNEELLKGQSIPHDSANKHVTGFADYTDDISEPFNTLYGAIGWSKKAHAKIKKIDLKYVKESEGVISIVTFKDIPGRNDVGPVFDGDPIFPKSKVEYFGQPLFAVAATSTELARKAVLKAKITYQDLKPIVTIEEALKKNNLLFDPRIIKKGEPENKIRKAKNKLKGKFNTGSQEHFYLEGQVCLVIPQEDNNLQVYSSTQHPSETQQIIAKMLNKKSNSITVLVRRIGGGFGGKTVVYLEPIALALSKKTGQPVKMVMNREEVFKASGPTSGAFMKVKIGVKKDGTITAADALLYYQAGAFQGSPIQPGAMCAFAPYDLEHVRTIGYDVVTNRPKVAAYRAPGGPISEYAVECVIDELAEAIDMDPMELRLKNAATEGTESSYGPKFPVIGLVDTLEAAKNHDHYQSPLGKNQGRGVATGFWFNIGGETCATLNIGADGTVGLVAGTPDIGGSRASLVLMAAEELGIEADTIRPVIGDTGSLGYNFLTGGSRAPFASGMAVVEAAQDIKRQLCERAARIWDIPAQAVTWEAGQARPTGHNAGEFEPMSLKDLAEISTKTGGPITGTGAINAQGAGPSFGTHIVDVEVDEDTGRVEVLRYTVVQDAGKAVHPSYVEGQMQGGAVQGIGWALNEEYIYDDDGKMQNAGFLDYRMPVCSDVPMIDTVIVEVPNPGHPYGVRGVGETPIIPPMAAITNAVKHAIGLRFFELPMSPPKILAAMEKNKHNGA